MSASRRRRSRGWRSAAWRGARRSRARTSTARWRGAGRTAIRRSSSTRWRSAAASTRGSPPAACGSMRRAPRPPTRWSSARLHSWRRAAQSWLEDPTQEQALILVSVVVDSRPVWGIHTGVSLAEGLRDARAHPALLRQLARFSLSFRPPTGFLRGLVVEHSGEHRGRLDLKHGGLVPIVDLARWAGMAAGVTSASTPGAPARRGRGGDALRRRTPPRWPTPSSSSWACASRITSSRSRRARSRRPHRSRQPEPAHPPIPQGCLPRRRVGPEGDLRRTQPAGAMTPLSFRRDN